MDINNISFSFEAVRWIVVAAIGVYSWLIGRQSASGKEMLDLRTRITQLEADVKQMPSQAQMHELALQVSRVAGSVDTLSERIEPIRSAVGRVENHLLTNNK